MRLYMYVFVRVRVCLYVCVRVSVHVRACFCRTLWWRWRRSTVRPWCPTPSWTMRSPI
uniref:Uncharacterized protein n=1 Tax=Anguilla anguilla TaxID=7936 RepID=A0A0E9QGG6_ANGAN